jgi:hypothetical protein
METFEIDDTAKKQALQATSPGKNELLKSCPMGFGQPGDGETCRHDIYEKVSMIRCSGTEHFDTWVKNEKKRRGKNHQWVDGVSWREYFLHEYSKNYGKRPAEGPNGFGAMYVPGKPRVCRKVRDALNKEFRSGGYNEAWQWKCTPVCLNKFNQKSKCGGERRRNRRIRRLPGNKSPRRYSLQKGHYGYSSDSSIVGPKFKSIWSRKDSRVVGLDFRKCECQTWGDSHLTYGYNVTKGSFAERRDVGDMPFVAEPTFQLDTAFQQNSESGPDENLCNRKWSRVDKQRQDGEDEYGSPYSPHYRGVCLELDSNGEKLECFCDIPVGVETIKKKNGQTKRTRNGRIRYTDITFDFSCGQITDDLNFFQLPSLNASLGGYPLWGPVTRKKNGEVLKDNSGNDVHKWQNCLQQCHYAVDALR